MLREGRIVQHNLFEQLDQLQKKGGNKSVIDHARLRKPDESIIPSIRYLIGQIGGHECLHRGRDVLGVLRLRERRLHHL